MKFTVHIFIIHLNNKIIKNIAAKQYNKPKNESHLIILIIQKIFFCFLRKIYYLSPLEKNYY